MKDSKLTKIWKNTGCCPYCNSNLYPVGNDLELGDGAVRAEYCCEDHDSCCACFYTVFKKPTPDNVDYEPISIVDNGSTW